MSAANPVQLLSPTKNILQQTNNNVPVITELKQDQKIGEKVGIIQRKTRRLSQEVENRLDTVKVEKSAASKLRRVRLEVSSQKSGVAQDVTYPVKVACYRLSSEESEEDEEYEEEEEKVRKPVTRPIIPNYVTKNDKGQYRKRRKMRVDSSDLSSQGGREAKPQPSISIAKRNARERNRVKLVNQGFATLRSRIPDYISEIYSEEKKKKNAKKVSKVETLRMALGYIRHLTEMLELRSTDPNEWFRIKTDDIPSWNNASNSSTGYPSPVETEYQQSPASGIYSSRDAAFYDYELELESVKDLSVKELASDCKDQLLIPASAPGYHDKGSLLLAESAFSVDVGCCYDLVKIKPELENNAEDEPEEVAEPKKTLPSITESFPKKNLTVFYGPSSFLSGSSTF